MTHIFTGTKTVIWHDLTEDPDDLPTNNIEAYRILCKALDDREIFCCYGYDEIRFEPDQNIWTDMDEDGYIYAIRSYGKEPVNIDPSPFDARYVDEWYQAEVVAWAEERMDPDIEAYVPAIFRKETEE